MSVKAATARGAAGANLPPSTREALLEAEFDLTRSPSHFTPHSYEMNSKVRAFLSIVLRSSEPFGLGRQGRRSHDSLVMGLSSMTSPSRSLLRGRIITTAWLFVAVVV